MLVSFKSGHITSCKCVAVQTYHNLGETSNVVLKRDLKSILIVGIILLLLFLEANKVLSVDKMKVLNVSLKMCINWIAHDV